MQVGSLDFAFALVIGSLHYLVTFDVAAKYFWIASEIRRVKRREKAREIESVRERGRDRDRVRG